MPKPALSVVPKAPRTNRILAALPPEEVEILRPHLHEVPLAYRQDLYEAAAPVEHVYFPHSGVASLLSVTKGGASVEIATIGPEGMVGMAVFLGAERTPHKAFIQVPGQAARIEADAFRHVIGRCPALNRLLLRYALALMNQMAQNAACNRVHSVEERCARWLLMTQDRVHSPAFPLTQEFLGQMLGVRRPTVSMAVGMLSKAGLIAYLRGHVTVLDRPGLEAASCECYRVIADEFERLVGAAG